MMLFLFANFGMAQEQKKNEDYFAQVGNRAQALRLHLLEDKVPSECTGNVFTTYGKQKGGL